LGFWEIKPETRREILEACPVPFPETLAYRIIKFYTYKNDLVLDPFGGSGTTNFVAALTGRRSIYIDNSEKSFNFAIERVRKAIENNLLEIKENRIVQTKEVKSQMKLFEK